MLVPPFRTIDFAYGRVPRLEEFAALAKTRPNSREIADPMPTSFPRLPRPDSDWALFLDFDGTLADIAERPDKVEVSPRLEPTLRSLGAALGGAVAIISGRPLDQLDGYLAPSVFPAAGLHGMERRGADGTVQRYTPRGDGLAPVRAALQRVADAAPGVILEDKDLSLALHFRSVPGHRKYCLEAVREAVAGTKSELEILAGKMVFEVKPSTFNKGSAVAAFLDEAPFIGRKPIFVGDDVTDEDGFAAANRLGGTSIRVGRGGASSSRFRVASVDRLLDWLELVASETSRQPREERACVV